MIKQRAFTLIELMIVIAIIAILAAIAYPNFADFIERQKLASAAEILTSDMKWAKSEAVKRNDIITVDFINGASGTWSYSLSDSDGEIKAVSGGNYSDFAIITMTQNFGADDTGFEPVRGTSLENGSVSLTSPSGMDLQVIISLLGRARICSNAGLPGYEIC